MKTTQTNPLVSELSMLMKAMDTSKHKDYHVARKTNDMITVIADKRYYLYKKWHLNLACLVVWLCGVVFGITCCSFYDLLVKWNLI